MDKHKVYEGVLHIAKHIARSKGGALFLLADERKVKNAYDLLFPNILTSHSLQEHGMDKVIGKLASLDGAVIISYSGKLIAFGAKLKKSSAVPGYGTRHAAASGVTSSIRNSTAILVSEESNWIKIFQEGKIVLEMDAEDNPKSMEDKIISFLSEGDTALLTAGGISAAILGGAAVAPIMIVGGTYLAIKTATGFIKRNWNAITKKSG